MPTFQPEKEPRKPAGRAPIERRTDAPSTPRRITGKPTLPKYLQQATSTSAISHASDPAEREAKTVAADIAREQSANPGKNSEEQSSAAPATPHALPENVRTSMEAAFGADFRDVRVHADADSGEASRALNARAYTMGNEIHFRPEEYRPHETAGRELLAHELTHVVQQRGANTAGGAPAVQRQPATTTAPPEPVAILDDASEQAHWRQRVDRAVRTQFGIRGDAISRSQVEFVNQAEFARRFPANKMEDILFDLFLSSGQRHNGTFYQILDYNRHPFLLAGASSPSAVSQLRDFIQQGISRGYFEGQTREYDVTTRQRFPVYRITPGELIAANVGGVTDIAPDRRRQRRITMQIGAYVHTFVHEACHLYISNRFRDMVQSRSDGGEYLRGARISQILLEGVAEYFARQVMRANPADFGPPNEGVYQDEVMVVHDLLATLGEASVRRAYFEGAERDVRRVAAAVDQYKQIHEDLLLPGFAVGQHSSTPPPSTP